MKYKFFTIVIFLFISTNGYTQNYPIINQIDLGVTPIAKGVKTTEQDFVFSYGKTHRLAHIYGTNDLNILSTHFSNRNMNENIDPILINDSIYVVLSEFNGVDVYKINNLGLEPITTIGLESDENNIYSYELMSVCDSLLFLGAVTYGTNYYFDLKIYNINDIFNPNLLYHYEWNPIEFTIKVLEHNNKLYFFQTHKGIYVTDSNQISNIVLAPATSDWNPEEMVWDAHLEDDIFYVYTINHITNQGYLRVFYEGIDGMLYESYSSEIPINDIFAFDAITVEEKLYVYGYSFLNEENYILKYQIYGDSLEFICERCLHDGVSKIIPFNNNFVVCGGSRVYIIDDDLNTIDILTDDSSVFASYDIMLNKFMIMSEWCDGFQHFRFYDLDTESFLAYTLTNADYFHNSILTHEYNDPRAIFILDGLKNIEIINFDESGISDINDYVTILDGIIYEVDAYENTVAIMRADGSSRYLDLYTIEGDELIFQNSNSIPLHRIKPLFIDESHIVYVENVVDNINIHYFKINTDYTLSPIESFPVTSNTIYLAENDLFSIASDSPVIDVSNPEEPFVEAMINIPYTTSFRLASFDGTDNYLFDNFGRKCILDSEFNHIKTWADVYAVNFIDNNIIAICEGDHITIADLPYLPNDAEINQTTSIINNYPNPFSSSTTISFSGKLNSHELTQIKIFNVKGQLVRELKIQNLKLKINEAVWDGKDETGREVKSGVYFCVVKTQNEQAVKKIIILR